MPNDKSHVELLRTKSTEELNASCEILKLAGIPHHASSTNAGFDISGIGRNDYSGADLFITVSAEDYRRARQTLEDSYAGLPLPEWHFLNGASDDDIREILAQPQEWSFHDVAQARRLAVERKLDVPKAEIKLPESALSGEGQAAPDWLTALGFVLPFVLMAPLKFHEIIPDPSMRTILAILGGLTSSAIGYALAYSKESAAESNRYIYDEHARQTGRRLILFGVIVIGLTIILPMARVNLKR